MDRECFLAPPAGSDYALRASQGQSRLIEAIDSFLSWLYREKKKGRDCVLFMDWGQSQILVTLGPFLNVDATKLIKIVKSLITLGFWN